MGEFQQILARFKQNKNTTFFLVLNCKEFPSGLNVLDSNPQYGLYEGQTIKAS